MLNVIEVLISKALIASYISHNEFVSVNTVLREYNEMKKGIKNPESPGEYTNKYSWYKQKKTKKPYERNGVKTIVDCDGILWLNEKRYGRIRS